MDSRPLDSDVVLRDPEFYSETVVFKVEDTLFRVLKSGLLYPGSFFETLFRLPTGEESTGIDENNQSNKRAPLEGTCDNHPIVLEQISKAWFRSFLRVLYPLEGITPCEGYDQWFGVLDLATMWDFPKKLGHPKPGCRLSARPPEEQILVSKKYNVKAWLQRAYQLVVRRKDPVSIVEMMQAGLDLETLSTLSNIRDFWFSRCTTFEEVPYDLKENQKPCGIRSDRCDTCYVYHHWMRCDKGSFNHGLNGMTSKRAEELVDQYFANELSSMRDD